MRTGLLFALIGIMLLTEPWFPSGVTIPYRWCWCILAVGFLLGTLSKPPSYDE